MASSTAAATSTTLFLVFNLLFFTMQVSSNTTPSATCPIDTLRLGVCANLLDNLLHVVVGVVPNKGPCCTLIGGLADLDAAVCPCTAIKANILGINLMGLKIIKFAHIFRSTIMPPAATATTDSSPVPRRSARLDGSPPRNYAAILGRRGRYRGRGTTRWLFNTEALAQNTIGESCDSLDMISSGDLDNLCLSPLLPAYEIICSEFPEFRQRFDIKEFSSLAERIGGYFALTRDPVPIRACTELVDDHSEVENMEMGSRIEANLDEFISDEPTIDSGCRQMIVWTSMQVFDEPTSPPRTMVTNIFPPVGDPSEQVFDSDHSPVNKPLPETKIPVTMKSKSTPPETVTDFSRSAHSKNCSVTINPV